MKHKLYFTRNYCHSELNAQPVVHEIDEPEAVSVNTARESCKIPSNGEFVEHNVTFGGWAVGRAAPTFARQPRDDRLESK